MLKKKNIIKRTNLNLIDWNVFIFKDLMVKSDIVTMLAIGVIYSCSKFLFRWKC